MTLALTKVTPGGVGLLCKRGWICRKVDASDDPLQQKLWHSGRWLHVIACLGEGREHINIQVVYGRQSCTTLRVWGTQASLSRLTPTLGGGGGRGVWTAETVKRPRQQPAHPQYANYWAPLTRKRHTMPHSAQSQHTNYWAPRTRKRHQQEHRPQRPTESSDPTQHAKGRTGDRPGPRKGATTGRNVTQGAGLGQMSPHFSSGGGPLRAVRCLQQVGVGTVASLHIHCHGVLWFGTPCHRGQDGVAPHRSVLLPDRRPDNPLP